MDRPCCSWCVFGVQDHLCPLVCLIVSLSGAPAAETTANRVPIFNSESEARLIPPNSNDTLSETAEISRQRPGPAASLFASVSNTSALLHDIASSANGMS